MGWWQSETLPAAVDLVWRSSQPQPESSQDWRSLHKISPSSQKSLNTYLFSLPFKTSSEWQSYRMVEADRPWRSAWLKQDHLKLFAQDQSSQLWNISKDGDSTLGNLYQCWTTRVYWWCQGQFLRCRTFYSCWISWGSCQPISPACQGPSGCQQDPWGYQPLLLSCMISKLTGDKQTGTLTPSSTRLIKMLNRVESSTDPRDSS